MRWGNDEKLAEKAKKIDLFLGGHDHEYGIKEVVEIILLTNLILY
jgi:5'-nucleotidase